MAERSIEAFRRLDDDAKDAAYQSVVSDTEILKAEVDQLRLQLAELKNATSAQPIDQLEDISRPCDDATNRQLQATENLICGLLAPVVDRLDQLEAKMRRTSSAESLCSAISIEDVSESESAKKKKPKAPKKKAPAQAESAADTAVTPDRPTKSLTNVAVSSVPQLGKDVLAWFHQMDFWFQTFKVAPSEAIPLIVSKLPSKDFMWVRYHLKTTKVTTWEQMKTAFRRRYNLDNEVAAKQKMFGASQRSGESCTDFAFRKLELIDECNYPETEAEKCRVILATLSDKPRKHYFDRRFASLDELLDSFLRFDQVVFSQPKTPALTVAAEPAQAAKVTKKASSFPLLKQDRSPPRQNADDGHFQQPLSPREKQGKQHVSPQRPSKASQNFRRSSFRHPEVRPLCLNCKKSGHFVTRCRQELTPEFLEWQQRFESTAAPTQGNDKLMPLTPARGHQ